MADDSEPPEKKADAAEETSLVQPNEGAPPPPSNLQLPTGGSVNIALMLQNPNAMASLSGELQERVFDGLEKDNERQFELSKMQLEMGERSRNASMLERQKAREQALDERKHVRRSVVGIGLVITALGSGIYIYLIATGNTDAATAFFADSMKVLCGALGGGGLTAIYKNSRRLP